MAAELAARNCKLPMTHTSLTSRPADIVWTVPFAILRLTAISCSGIMQELLMFVLAVNILTDRVKHLTNSCLLLTVSLILFVFFLFRARQFFLVSAPQFVLGALPQLMVIIPDFLHPAHLDIF